VERQQSEPEPVEPKPKLPEPELEPESAEPELAQPEPEPEPVSEPEPVEPVKPEGVLHLLGENVEQAGCTATLLTTVFLLRSAPSATPMQSTLVTVLAALVFACQAMFAYKLESNAHDTSLAEIEGFLREGWLSLDLRAFNSSCFALVTQFPPSAGPVLNISDVTEGQCRLSMSRAFVGRFEEMQVSPSVCWLPYGATASGLPTVH
jgi:hypothetical protein